MAVRLKGQYRLPPLWQRALQEGLPVERETIEMIYRQKRMRLVAKGRSWAIDGVFEAPSDYDYLETAAEYEQRTGRRPLCIGNEWQPPREWRCDQGYRLLEGRLQVQMSSTSMIDDTIARAGNGYCPYLYPAMLSGDVWTDCTGGGEPAEVTISACT